jgi:pimeloyl-ACP methyl ester carboxylesterase
VSYIREQRLENVILVGHSFGGSVVQKVAEEIPSLVERTVFLDALIVEDDHCVFDELPAEYVALFNDLARESSNNTMLIPWEVWRDNFIQDAPESWALSLWEQLSPEPNQVNLDRLDLKRFYSLAIPRSFIYSTR